MNVTGRDNNLRTRGRGGRGRGKSGTLVVDQTTNILPKYQIAEHRRPLLDLAPTSSSGDITPRTTRRKKRGTTGSSTVRGRTTVSTTIRGTSSGSPGSIKDTHDKFVIVAITGGRGDARGEIGMAAMDAQYPHMILCQISDNNSYMNTLTKILMFQPVEILLPVTMGSNDPNPKSVFNVIREEFKNIPITEIARMHYNATVGFERIQTHCAEQFSSVELIVNSKYYALAATAALFKYIEHIQHIVYSPKSMRIDYQAAENVTMIDIESAKNLELVACNGTNSKFSLLGALDRCSTPMGRRLLRASILQPPCDEEFIRLRQRCVEELVSNRSLHLIVQPVIRRLFGTSRLLSLAMKTTQTDTVQCAERNLNYVLLLKNTIDIIPELRAALRTARAPFFKKVCEDLSDERFDIINKKILSVVQPDAKSLKGHTSANMQRCFAINVKINDMLDISRQAYCELIDDMKNMVEKLGEKYNLALSLGCNNSLGFHIQMDLPKTQKFDISKLPKEFIHVHKKNRMVFMTTERVVVFSQHCKDACDEIHLMSNAILDEVLVELRKYIGCLFRLIDDIAELDLVMSLASISSITDYVKPTFEKSLDVKDSKHPISDIMGSESPTPNNIVASIAYNFHTITGPNMSGKSFYLRQIVLLHIMAQIGCYVPASKAQFRIADRIFCRLSMRDDLEFNASTFTLEIKEAQYIVQSITEKSLVVLDELCRSTTVEEGSSIAWEICKVLLFSPAFTFSATHFTFLWKLADVYPNVTNHHLEAIPNVTDRPDEARLVYTHKLREGVVVIDHYGMILARSTCLPKKVLDTAQILIEQIEATMKTEKMIEVDVDPRVKTNYDSLASVYQKLEENELEDDQLLDFLKKLNLVGYSDQELSDIENKSPNKLKSKMGALTDRITNFEENCDGSFCQCQHSDSDLSEISHQNSKLSQSSENCEYSSKRRTSRNESSEPIAKIQKLDFRPPNRTPNDNALDSNYLGYSQLRRTPYNASVTPKKSSLLKKTLMKNILTDPNSPLFIPKAKNSGKSFVMPKRPQSPKFIERSPLRQLEMLGYDQSQRKENTLNQEKKDTKNSVKSQILIPEYWQQQMRDKKTTEGKESIGNASSIITTVETPPQFSMPKSDNHDFPPEFRHMRHLLKNIDYLQPSTPKLPANKTPDYFFSSDIIKRHVIVPETDLDQSSEVIDEQPKLKLLQKSFSLQKEQNFCENPRNQSPMTSRESPYGKTQSELQDNSRISSPSLILIPGLKNDSKRESFSTQQFIPSPKRPRICQHLEPHASTSHESLPKTPTSQIHRNYGSIGTAILDSKQEPSTSHESFPFSTRSKLNTEFEVASTCSSTVLLSNSDFSNIDNLMSMTDSDEEFEQFISSQISVETSVAQLTARKKEAAVFRLIEGSQFDEKRFLASQTSCSSSLQDNITVID